MKGSQLQQAAAELLLEVAGLHALEFDPGFVGGPARRRRRCRRLGADDRPQPLLGAARVDRRRLERDPAQHPRQDRARTLTRPWTSTSPTSSACCRTACSGCWPNAAASNSACASRDEPGGYSRALWSRYAEMGLLGLPFAEGDGGLGGGPVDTLIVMQALGRALALEPYLADGGAGRRLCCARPARRRSAMRRWCRDRRGRAARWPSRTPKRSRATTWPT